MKNIFILLSLLMTMFVEAVAQNDAMFVYRNDGVINAFLKTDIDSIRHSNLDVDSVLHKEYVVQEVWTVDSVYRIPLAIIDSVSFVTPPTVYKDGVVKIGEELLKYVIGAEELTLQLYSNIPSSLIPHTDDLLILLEGCEVLPNGFSGKVKSVNAHSDCIEVVCEQAYIEDIFDSFCSVQTVVGYADNNENDPSLRSSSFAKRAIYNPKDIVFHLGPFSTSLNADISKKIIPNGDLALKGGLDGSISFKPTFRIHTFVLVGDGQGLYFNSSITGNLEVSSLLSIYGGLEWEHNFMDPEVAIPIPSTGGLLSFYINPGYFTRANALITGNITARVNYSFGMGFDYSSECESLIKTSIGGCLASSSTDIEGCIDGSIAVGGFIETGICLAVKKLNSRRIGYRGEYGVQARGNFVLTNSDIKNAEKETVVYERLKASSLEWGPFVNASYINASLQTQGSISWQISRAEKTWDIVPTFKKTKLTHTSSIATSADAYSELSGNCFIPVIPVGYKLFDGIMNEVADYDALYFTNKECLMEHRFNNLSRGKNYTLYPTVSLFGYEMLASPSAKLTTNTHAAITRFDVTNSEYKSGAFMNDGLYYDYKFNVSLTVEIDNLDGVEDWGYVYRDPYGNIKRISLMKHGFSYTDTDYGYYRNEAHSTACLYTYVKYEGDSEYYDGEPHEYPLDYEEKEKLLRCPDGNHPHAIDLGLPSGTKWACCNVGASSPEGYGGYYAWGETKEKNYYYWDTYAYSDWQGNCSNIGSDISGTQYDVARVRMGAPWCMPTLEQQTELEKFCKRDWTIQNGVSGVLVTGPSGGQVFLPAASHKCCNEKPPLGSYGYYWSSTLNSGEGAYYIYFDYDYWGRDWYFGGRCDGSSVRPVCP